MEREEEMEREGGSDGEFFLTVLKSYISVYISSTAGNFTAYKTVLICAVFTPSEVKNSFNSRRRRDASGSSCLDTADSAVCSTHCVYMSFSSQAVSFDRFMILYLSFLL